MNFTEYQEKIKEFRLKTADEGYVLLGLVGELGELYGYIAKAMRDEFELDKTHVAKELGDIQWFMASLATDLGLDMQNIANMNAEKLASRKERGVLTGSGDNR